jgi:hypothetical protein
MKASKQGCRTLQSAHSAARRSCMVRHVSAGTELHTLLAPYAPQSRAARCGHTQPKRLPVTWHTAPARMRRILWHGVHIM